MKKLLIASSFLLLLLTNSCQDFNSNTFDEFRFSGFDLSTDTGQAMKIINDKCVNCHSGYHAAWSAEVFRADIVGNNNKWVSEGLIEAAPFTNSLIIERLFNYGGNMPQGGSSLTSQEIFYLCSWIEGGSGMCPAP